MNTDIDAISGTIAMLTVTGTAFMEGNLEIEGILASPRNELILSRFLREYNRRRSTHSERRHNFK